MNRSTEDPPILPEWPYVLAGGAAGVMALTLLALAIGPRPAAILVYPFLLGFAFLGYQLAPKRPVRAPRFVSRYTQAETDDIVKYALEYYAARPGLFLSERKRSWLLHHYPQTAKDLGLSERPKKGGAHD